jgi:hypothetical protein
MELRRITPLAQALEQLNWKIQVPENSPNPNE